MKISIIASVPLLSVISLFGQTISLQVVNESTQEPIENRQGVCHLRQSL